LLLGTGGGSYTLPCKTDRQTDRHCNFNMIYIIGYEMEMQWYQHISYGLWYQHLYIIILISVTPPLMMYFSHNHKHDHVQKC
jgi:hypothetical protein